MNTDPQIDLILDAVEQLRTADLDGPHQRKLVDALFRNVHTFKARAASNGFTDLAAAAHEFENVLHEIRKTTLQQSLSEGAKLFRVQTSFDVADFDREFQSLKETLSSTGEIISTSPYIDKERPGKVNFEILYARKTEDGETMPELSNAHVVSVERISKQQAAIPGQSNKDITSSIEGPLTTFLAELVSLSEMFPGGVFQQALQAGQAAALATGKDVEFDLCGSDQDLDEALCEPLIHLVRNAVAHGIETQGRVIIECVRHHDHLTITVSDDGRGIDPALQELIFQPGFSTAAEVSNISGRGVGLDVVKTSIESLGGSVTVRSKPGHGSTFEINIPL